MDRYPLLAVGLLICLVASAADRGVPIQVAGGTLPDVQAKTRGRMDLTGAEVLAVRFDKSEMELRIDYRKVNTLEYGQNVAGAMQRRSLFRRSCCSASRGGTS